MDIYSTNRPVPRRMLLSMFSLTQASVSCILNFPKFKNVLENCGFECCGYLLNVDKLKAYINIWQHFRASFSICRT